MPCVEFEDLLAGYEDLPATGRYKADAHLAVCLDCREYFESLSDLDRKLTGLYAGLHLSSDFASSVMSRASRRLRVPVPLRPPSVWPEVLDFCGWAAVTAIAAMLVVGLAEQAGIPLGFLSR